MRSKKGKKLNHYIRLACLTGAIFCYSASAFAEVMSNAQLPTGGDILAGSGSIGSAANNIMNITGLDNTVIKWDDFSIGSIATVNFSGQEGFNVLNYVNGGNMSQIHGTMNATGGNVYLVNPAGVFIGKSAQIDVGSLYVSNKTIGDVALSQGFEAAVATLNTALPSSAELMSLGHINANSVTFDGSRIVLDTEYVTRDTDTPIGSDNITIIAPDNENVVLGYEAYDETTGYENANSSTEKLANYKTNSTAAAQGLNKNDGYMWIEDVEQLQAMQTNTSGNYALRNGIDATNTAETPFQAITNFSGKLDGLAGNVEGVDFSIFDLHVDGGDSDNVGLFANTTNATLKNLIFVSGSTEGSGSNIGTLVGSAVGGVIDNVQSSSNVTGGAGSTNVGGIVGSADNVEMSDLLNTGKVEGSSNVGGLVGSMAGGSLTGGTNIGQINGVNNGNAYSHDIGGIVGSITGGADLNDVENTLTVTGGYNVGGIAGSAENVTIIDATNTADITADGYTTEEYYFHTVYTGETNYDAASGTAHKTVQVANVGGIVGNISGASTLNTVTNDGGNVQSGYNAGDAATGSYYEAGNVGGIAGRVEGGSADGAAAIITNAVNKENTVYGAHNVGGIAGYLANGTISSSVNNGGDIMATGARNNNNFITESIRSNNAEVFNVGNMGGIAGYMYGDNAYISQSGNRGSVHSQEIADNDNVPTSAQAANVGGIVGKIDRSDTLSIDNIKNDSASAAVNDSYNTGDVQGYTGVGGIAGFMYNGEIAGSYNLGTIQSTRIASTATNAVDPLNMGGIVGDTTEESNADVVLYDVYNTGVIGDEDFTYVGRHVGGIVGRLSGTVEKAYNTGAIYNGYNVVGGIAGYMTNGNIKDSFNTGNITVVNNNDAESQVGGIVGTVATSDNAGASISIENVYNLGTIRSFESSTINNSGDNIVGGIIGYAITWGGNLNVTINNAYTLGDLYAASYANNSYTSDTDAYVGAAYGKIADNNTRANVSVSNAYYIQPELTDAGSNNGFHALSLNGGNRTYANYLLNGATSIAYSERTKADSYGNFSFSGNGSDGTAIDTTDSPWRIYEGSTTPILNAFLPKAEDYFSNAGNYEGGVVDLNEKNIGSLQYGTAYNPMLTIINAINDANITLDWAEMGVTKGASFAVYDGSLTITNFDNSGNYFGGTLYAEDALTISNSGDIMLGSGANLYGSSISVESGGELSSYGSITSTGTDGNADITLSGDEGVEIIGTVKSAANEERLNVEGIDSTANVGNNEVKDALDAQIRNNINNVNEAMPDVAEYYGVLVDSAADGDVTITSANGDVNVLFGVAEKGYISSAGSLSFSGSSVYVDSDVSFGTDADDKFTITADEAVLDISNIGKVQDADNSVNVLHNFLAQGSKLSFAGKSLDANGNAITPDAIIAIDMWDDANGEFNLDQYDNGSNTFANAVRSDAFGADNLSKIHIWLDNAEQLQGINRYYANNADTGILSYQFALKNDIDANSLENFHGICYTTGGSGVTINAFTGSLDGRGYSIIGLNASGTENNHVNDYVGLFSRIGAGGSVKDLNIISSNFTGGSVGAVAGRNEGTIENVTTFGNRVTSANHVETGIFGDTIAHTVGAAGGITGINQGTIKNVTASDAVIAGVTAGTNIDSTAGGIAGINISTSTVEDEQARIESSAANSAVTSSAGNANALGGVIGINYGVGAVADVVESLGVVNGNYKAANNTIKGTENIGGIAGVNYNGASIYNAYNEAHISGSNGVGGIVGFSGAEQLTDAQIAALQAANNWTDEETAAYVEKVLTTTIENAVNAGIVIGSSEGLTNGAKAQNTGGLVGNSQSASISNARNTGAIHGVNNVGGMVGTNGANSTLTNVTNDGSATIEGETNVGGIAGVNAGAINAEASQLINNGTIHGNNTVGGIAGLNTGTIENTNSNITLYATGAGAEYFGGVVGRNGDGTNNGIITNATNTGDVIADGATYVGGITGHNTKTGTISGASNANSGTVTGGNYVGGVAGLNEGTVSGTDGNVTGIRNDGYVHATAGGAGGIFGENRADFTNVKLVNGGIVYGEGSGTADSGTGGVIGVNSGNISKSDIIGEAGGVVIGSENVGGLIGINTGTVAGGRDDDDNYYAHQVYNNGTVVGGVYKEVLADTDDANDWKAVDANDTSKGYYRVSADSSNIGGLVGSNAVDAANVKTGSLTAAYSTASVVGGSNVGGVVGTNSGTVDQVFSVGNVNNVVADNQGTLKNAYSNNTKQSLDKDDNAAAWKIYGDGQDLGSTKLLSVFLTKLTFTPEKGFDYSLIYNAKEQGFKVQPETDGTFGVYTVGRDLNVKVGTLTSAAGVHSLQDYVNSNDLLENSSNSAVGTGYALFNTKQIAGANNLGFDFGTYDIDTANLIITLDAVERTYGDDTLTNKNTSTNSSHVFIDAAADGNNENKYGFTISVADNGIIKGELNDSMLEALLGLNGAANILSVGSVEKTNDGAVAGTSGNRKTNDAKTYEWSTSFELGLNSSGYQLVTDIAEDGTVIATSNSLAVNDVVGESVVNKASLTINIGNASTIYGTAFDESKYGYTFDELVNGDNDADKEAAIREIINNGLVYSNGAAEDGTNGVWTKDADTYEDAISLNKSKDDLSNALKNYNVVTINSGDAEVTKADLVINVGNASTIYGTAFDESKYGYTFDKLVNGDTAEAKEAAIRELINNGLVYSNGAAKDGTDGVWTKDADTYEDAISLNKSKDDLSNTLKNYNVVTINSGDAEVTKADLVINVGNASTIYGTAFDESKYGYTFDKLVNGDTAEAKEAAIRELINNGLVYSNGAAKDGTDGVWTKDADTYEDAISLNKSKDDLSNALKNYNVVTINSGDAEVAKADLVINVGNASTIYGTAFDESKYGYTFDKLVNGDTAEAKEAAIREIINNGLVYSNGAAKDGTDGVWTADADTYEDAISLNKSKDDLSNTLRNYNVVTINNGDAEVTKANLVINVGDATTKYGTAFDESKYGYTFDKLVNGDTAEAKEAAIREIINNGLVYSNGAAEDGTDGVWTKDADTYEDAISLNKSKDDLSNALKNYNVVTINEGDAVVEKASLTITLDDVERTYGNMSIEKGEYAVTGADLVNGDTATKWLITGNIDDDGLIEANGEIRTNNAGTHEWNVGAEGITAEGVANLHTNYEIEVKAGNSVVNKKELTLNDVFTQIIYGQQDINWKDLASDKVQESLKGVVYGDDVTVSLGNVTVSGGYAVNKGDRDTADAGTYAGSLSISDIALAGEKAGNYSIQTTESGGIEVLKAALSVTVDDKDIIVGETPSYTGSVSAPVNGDTLIGLGFGAYDLDSSANVTEIGEYDIGVWIGDRLHFGDTTLKNYEVKIIPGTLTVNPIPYGPDPQNPDWWDAEDKYPWYQWDKQHNARERKAEVHFVDGGMAIH